MTHRASPAHRAAFTLVEVLLVVAVVALLLSVLAPSLGGARDRARDVLCLTNLRQLGAAFHQYASDQRDYALPLGVTSTAATPGAPTVVFWWGSSSPTGVDYAAGFVAPYLPVDLKREASVFNCPRQPWGSYVPTGGASDEPTSTYGYNGYYLSPAAAPGWSFTIGHRPWQTLFSVRHPARLLAFADTLIDMGAAQPSNNPYLDPPLLYQGRGRWRVNQTPTTAFRHNDATQALMVDGHVSEMQRIDGRITSEAHQIGAITARPDPFYIPDWREWRE